MKIVRIFSTRLHTAVMKNVYLFDNGLKDIDRKNKWNTFPIQIACTRKIRSSQISASQGRKNKCRNQAWISLSIMATICFIFAFALNFKLQPVCLFFKLPICQHLIDGKNGKGLGSGRISGNPKRKFKGKIGLKFQGKIGKFKGN
jgi:hypothetical protein